jgi:ADP-ribose diphosphatase
MDEPAEQIVFKTSWFQVVARHPPGFSEPHYSLKALDYVGVAAVTPAGEFILVRQFRPTLWTTTLELPAGHVEQGQTPEEAARAELLEETGYECGQFDFLGHLCPDTGRIGNRLWCFFAGNATPTRNRSHAIEAGIEPVVYRGSLRDLTREPEFCSAASHAILLAAVRHGKLAL